MRQGKKAQRSGNRIVDDALQFIASHYTNLALVQLTQWKSEALRSIDKGLSLDIEQALPLIEGVEKWKDAVNKRIVQKRMSVIAGNSYHNDFELIGDPPVSFTEVYLAGHPDDRPDGWTVPDVSTYEPYTNWTQPSND